MSTRVGYLFAEVSLGDWLVARQEQCKQQILRADEAKLFGEPPEDWAKRLAGGCRVEPIALQADAMTIEDLGERQISPYGKVPGGVVVQPSAPTIPGRHVVVHIPFSGQAELFRMQPSSYSMNPPQAGVGDNELLLPFTYASSNRPDIKAQADEAITNVEQSLRTQAEDIARFNGELERFAAEVIAGRRKRVLEDREHLDGFGIPVQRRDDAPKTYAAPGIERHPAPRPPASEAQSPQPMEPTLVDDFYRHIIEVISAMARGMERTPGDYATWPEEKLRDVLLVILNTHYKGQATGETFNKSGKTDIIVRIEDRNVFVDECKWWKGAASFAGPDREEDPSAVDQLLSYTTWRDAKLALTVFVANKNIARVIKAAREALEAHPAFVNWTEPAVEGQLRCRVRLPGTDERAADLAVIFVHLPRD